MGFIIKKGKKLFKEGKEKLGPFTPISTEQTNQPNTSNKVPIIINWDKKKSIRFYQVCDVVEFLKKCA